MIFPKRKLTKEEKIALRPWKKCLCCGKEYQHNNAFCSAECCHRYKTFSIEDSISDEDFMDTVEAPR